MSIRFAVLLLIPLAACAPRHNSWMLPGPQPPAWGTPEWHAFVAHLRDSLQHADPQRAADSAIGRGDFHLLGVLSDGLEVPGVANWERYKPGIYILPATGDAMEGPDHGAYIGVAYEYAEKYNKAIMARRPPDR